MLLTQAGTCLLLCDVVVMRFITPPNSSSFFEVSAIIWDVILMTFVATLYTYGIASRNISNEIRNERNLLAVVCCLVENHTRIQLLNDMFHPSAILLKS